MADKQEGTPAKAKTARAKRAPRVPENETPSQRFMRMGVQRTKTAIAKIRLVGKLAGRGYQYDEQQAKVIIGKLREELSAVERALLKQQSKAEEEFTLPEPAAPEAAAAS